MCADEDSVHFLGVRLLPYVASGVFERVLIMGPRLQKDPRSMGRRIGMLTAIIPARVSLTPQRLMFRALGETCRDITTRMTAAAITKTPGNRRRDRLNFLLRLTSRFQSIGIGVTMIMASVRILAVEAT